MNTQTYHKWWATPCHLLNGVHYTSSLFAVVFAVLSCAHEPGKTTQRAIGTDNGPFVQVIARLGFEDKDLKPEMSELAKNPRVSVGILVDSLHVISDPSKAAKEDTPETEHVLCMIRALKYLTGGMEFCSSCEYLFGSSEEEQNRKYWLSFRHQECLTFFAVWPSRGRTYIAPVEVQRSVISQWQNWYAEHGRNFEYRPLQDPNPMDWMI